MTCFNPKPATYEKFQKIDEKTGEIYESRRIRFLSLDKITPETPNKENVVMIPCGKCAGCQIDKSNDWATRAMLEAKLHKKNCFVTLTYDNDHISKNRSLIKKDIQNFFKRLRNHTEEKLRYIVAGEYGPRTLRPHFHAIIYNYRPKDLKLFSENKTGNKLYTSKELEKIWGKGYCIVGNVDYQSAAYVARYVLKKAFGITKEIYIKHNREPEFQLASRRGGIGSGAFENEAIKAQIKQNLGILINVNGQVIHKKIPNFLRNKWKNENREEYFKIFDKRAHELKEQARTRKTSKNSFQYLNQIIEKTKKQIKRLDKRQDL